MIPGRPSRTAQHNALFRALEQRLDDPLFSDPWARRSLRGRYRLAAWLPARMVTRAIDRRWPGPRAAVVVRTRYIDEAIVAALCRGLDQLVILGAGLDARVHRLPGLSLVRVFELDHPSTQALKRQVVGTTPSNLVYVPFDFATDRLGGALEEAGFRPATRTLVVWEGVTNYLDARSIDATLWFIAGTGADLIFTYVDESVLSGRKSFAGGAESVAYVRSLERFTFGWDPAALGPYLRDRNLALAEDFALPELAHRFYVGPPPPVSSYYHVAQARCRG
jgi:methyltransferase (TIGR00027 family)